METTMTETAAAPATVELAQKPSTPLSLLQKIDLKRDELLSLLDNIDTTLSNIRTLSILVEEVDNKIKIEITKSPLSVQLSNDRLRDAYLLEERLKNKSWQQNKRRLDEEKANLKKLEATLKVEQTYYEHLCSLVRPYSGR
jgi:hypothetical protein